MNSQTIARNAGLLLLAQLVTWSLTLALAVVMPRTLGASAIGQLQLAGSIWSLLAVLITFGTDRFLTKQISREPQLSAMLFVSSVSVRSLLFLPALGLAVAWVWLLGLPTGLLPIVLASGLAALLWQFIDAAQAALLGLERMAAISLANIAGKALNTVLCIGLLLLAGADALAVALIGSLAAVLTLAIQLRALSRLHPLRLQINPAAARAMLGASLPYLLSSACLVGYQQIDVIVISLLVDPRTLGWYAVSNQLFGTLLFLPTALLTALFPALARSHTSAASDLNTMLARSFDLLLTLMVPLGIGLLVIAEPLTLLLFGAEFAPAAAVISLLGIVLIITSQNVLLGQVFTATDRQNRWTSLLALAAVATIPLDLLLVPWANTYFGNAAVGGGLSYLITELCMLLAGIGLLPRTSFGWQRLRAALRVLLIGILMGLLVWPLRYLPLIVPIAAGALVYLPLALLLALTPADRQLLRGAATALLARLRRKTGRDPLRQEA